MREGEEWHCSPQHVSLSWLCYYLPHHPPGFHVTEMSGGVVRMNVGWGVLTVES